MAEKKSSPTSSEPESESVWETESSTFEDTSSSNEDRVEIKRKENIGLRKRVKKEEPEVSWQELTKNAQKLMNSQSATNKLKAFPVRTYARNSFAVIREIQGISKHRNRTKQIRRVLKNYLDSLSPTSLIAAQTLRSKTSSVLKTSQLQFPSEDCLKKVDVDNEPSSFPEVTFSELNIQTSITETDDSSKTSPLEHFMEDRSNNLYDVSEEINELKNLLMYREILDTNTSGSSNNFRTQDGFTLHKLAAAKILANLEALDLIAKGMQDFMYPNHSIKVLKNYMNLLNTKDFTSPYSRMLLQRLVTWEMDKGSLSQLGDATCLLQIENRLISLQQTLIAEGHVIYYKCWSEKIEWDLDWI